nr:hypothetical protein [uncultured Duganella sp.]
MRLLFSALMALAVAPQLHAAVTLQVSASAGERTTQMDVTLADSYMAVDTAKGRLVYDFPARRRYAINTAAGEFVEYSLFDTVGFRVMEMRNRDALRGALAAAKDVDMAAMSKHLHENELSLLSGAPDPVEEKNEGDLRVFYIGGEKLAAWSVSGAKVGAADAAQFARFMRYQQGGHPQLLEILVRDGKIPDRMTLFVSGGRSLSLVITQVRSASPPAYDLKPYRREIGQDGIDAALDRIAAASPQQLDALRAQYPCDASDDFSAARALDTMLGKMECVLSTGAPLSLTEQQKQAVGASPALMLLFAALNPAKPEEVDNAVKTLAGLRQQAPRKAYVLKVFEANSRLRLKQPKQAAVLFVEALQANPLLAGAYKDLGDLMMLQYDSVHAWRSWDAGRRVSPALPNFVAVNKFEAELLAQHPEYF